VHLLSGEGSWTVVAAAIFELLFLNWFSVLEAWLAGLAFCL